MQFILFDNLNQINLKVYKEQFDHDDHTYHQEYMSIFLFVSKIIDVPLHFYHLQMLPDNLYCLMAHRNL